VRMMASAYETVLRLLDRAAAEPAFREQLLLDPLGVAWAHGVRVSISDLKLWLRIPEATDAEALELLKARLARAAP